MYTFGRRLYYKLISGEPIVDTGEVITTMEKYKRNTVEEDLRELPELKGYSLTDIGYIDLDFEEYKEDFENLTFFRVDAITQTIHFVHKEEETEIAWDKPLIYKVKKLEDENEFLGVESSEREIQQMLLGQQISDIEIRLLMGGI